MKRAFDLLVTLDDFVWILKDRLGEIDSEALEFLSSPARIRSRSGVMHYLQYFYEQYRDASPRHHEAIITAALLLCYEEHATRHLSQSSDGFRQIAAGMPVVDDYYLREAAHRAAGYLVVAAVHDKLALGAEITPSYSPNGYGLSRWTGQLCGLPQGRSLPEVGVAGGAAVMLFKDPITTALDVGNLLDYSCGGGEIFTLMSATEAALVGSADVQTACESAVQILIEHQEAFVWCADRLFRRRELCPEEVAAYFTNRLAHFRVAPCGWPSMDSTTW